MDLLVSKNPYVICPSFSLFVQAQARKAALRKIPEQTVLSEVRRMVEDMQALNKRLEETVSFTCTWRLQLTRPCKITAFAA